MGGVNGAVSQHVLEAVVAAGRPEHVRVAILDLRTVEEGVPEMTGRNDPATTTAVQHLHDQDQGQLCHRRCCWIWCWYRNSFRKFDHRIRQKPLIEATAVLI